MSEVDSRYVWQDREIRFDLPFEQLKPRKGEVEIDSINAVEDTKGNNGVRGALSVTNLRIIWVAHDEPGTNLSIGWSCVMHTSVKDAASRLRGHTQGLYVMTRFNSSRFEFIFTSLVKGSPRLFTTAQNVFLAYSTTKLYRDLKLRGAIIKDRQLLLLPDEAVFNKVDGVMNLSSDQGNLGTYFITNVRLVWHANLAENFNVSIPYMQIKAVKVRDSKFGPALVIETSPRSGGYILGFRIDPYERLTEVYKEIQRLHEVYSAEPIFGVQFKAESKPKPFESIKVERKEDDVQIVDTEDHFDTLAAYYASGSGKVDRPPVFSPELGLAVEQLPDNISIEQLWSVST
eukprot:TRINITY_DN67856_c2_g1_i13.p2 TRINITY_DN67856_c2_g1~~TRINITY_DN67856_c2_g1_i13.p2  ORF type:complete len:345 (+),score=162.90 TRINITY_DN67856_c2_g1_i13:1572-2606(+)